MAGLLPDPETDDARTADRARELEKQRTAEMDMNASMVMTSTGDLVEGPGPHPRIKECPKCKVSRHERGDALQYYWRCGCAIEPDRVSKIWTALDRRCCKNPHYYEEKPSAPDAEELWAVSSSITHTTMYPCGSNPIFVEYRCYFRAVHPTREGAIAEWRKRLANFLGSL